MRNRTAPAGPPRPGGAPRGAFVATDRSLLFADGDRRDLPAGDLVDDPQVEIAEDEAAAVRGVDPVTAAGHSRERHVFGAHIAVEGRVAVEVPHGEAVLAGRDAHPARQSARLAVDRDDLNPAATLAYRIALLHRT